MSDYGAEQAGVGTGREAETWPDEFTTAFRSGTGGHHIAVLADRIVSYYRVGGSSQLPLVAIVSASTFESGFSQPAFGVLFETHSPRRSIGYRFEDDATRRAFVRAVQRRIGREAASGGDLGTTRMAHGADLWSLGARR